MELQVEVDEMKDKEYTESAICFKRKADSLKIVIEEDKLLSIDIISQINTNVNQIVAEYKKLKAPLQQAHKKICEAERVQLGNSKEVIKTIKMKMAEYDTQVEAEIKEKRRIAAAEENRLAKIKADEERERLLLEAENADIPEEKDELLEQAILVVPEPEPAAMSKRANKTVTKNGASATKVKKIEISIQEKKKYVQYCLNQPYFLGTLEINETKLKRIIKDGNYKNGSIPGVEIKETFGYQIG